MTETIEPCLICEETMEHFDDDLGQCLKCTGCGMRTPPSKEGKHEAIRLHNEAHERIEARVKAAYEKIVRVSNCGGCPFLNRGVGDVAFCNAPGAPGGWDKAVKDLGSMPSWCPIPLMVEND